MHLTPVAQPHSTNRSHSVPRHQAEALSHLNQVPAKQLDQISLQGIILGSFNNFICDVLEIGDVEQPPVCFKEYLGRSKARPLVPLLEWVRRNHGHHQSNR